MTLSAKGCKVVVGSPRELAVPAGTYAADVGHDLPRTCGMASLYGCPPRENRTAVSPQSA